MLKSSQFTCSAVIAATVISLGATPAVARRADMPSRSTPAVTTVNPDSRLWTQPRVDAMGVRPADAPVAGSATPAVPLTRVADDSGGRDWLLVAIGAASMLALLLILAVVRTNRHPAHPFRAPQV